MVGMILAAGLSSRMNAFKPMLHMNGETVIQRVIGSMRMAGIDEIVVVTGYNASALMEHLSEQKNVRTVYNPDYAHSDMLKSVQCGIRALPNSTEAIVLTPVDVFLPDGEVYRLIGEPKAEVVIPTHNARRGHPIYIGRSFFEKILSFDSEGGLKALFNRESASICEIEVNSDTILYDADTREDFLQMSQSISTPVKRKDHDEKISGRVKFVSDYIYDSNNERYYSGHFVRSAKAYAKILSITPPKMPDDYTFITKDDVPNNISYYPCNDLPISYSDEERNRFSCSMPIFPEDTAMYYGQPLAMIVGPDDAMVRKLIAQTKVEYEEYPPIIDFVQSKEIFFEAERTVGSPKEAFMDTDDFYIEHVTTGRQYQAYLEPQGLAAENTGDGGIFLHGSMQCPFPVKQAVAMALNLDEDKVRVRQDATGGGFGGKEEFPSFLASFVAVAAYVTGKSVRIVLDRNEDLQFASKRHPSYSSVRFGVKDGEIVAVDVLCKLDAGAYITSSADVAMTYFLKFPNAYTFPNLHVHIMLMRSNTPPCGAFRGFGNPQSCFAIDNAMCHLASDLGVDSLAFRRKYWAKTGGMTATGGTYHYKVPLEDMLAMAEKSTDYSIKRALYDKPQTGRYRRGIGIGFANQGATLAGSNEWVFVKATARLHKSADGRVEVITGQCEIGQGIRTAFAKIVAKTLNISVDMVDVNYPDTSRCANTGPTAASRSVMIVGKAVMTAALNLKKIWEDGKEQEAIGIYDVPDEKWEGFDFEKFVGDSYAEYLWSNTVVEVEVDTYTGKVRILNAHGVYGVGTPIDINILTGQMEGGLLQGIGYAAFERMVIGESGRMFNTAFADYHMPTFSDVENLSVEFCEDKYDFGPFGAKGAGEIPIPAVPSAYLSALEQALGGTKEHKLRKVPFVPEDVIKEFCEEGAMM